MAIDFVISTLGILIAGFLSIFVAFGKERVDGEFTRLGKTLLVLRIVAIAMAFGGLLWGRMIFLTTDKAWSFLSSSLLSEPSGLVDLNYSHINGRRGRFGLAVDDEHANIFLLREDKEGNPRAVAVFLVNVDNDPAPEDFEAIGRVGERVYVLTSHRLKGKKNRRSRQFIRVRIDQDVLDAVSNNNRLSTSGATRTDLEKNKKLSKCITSLNNFTVDISDWENKLSNSDTPYSVELEGLTGLHSDSDNDYLAVGIKAPRFKSDDDGKFKAGIFVIQANRGDLDDSTLVGPFAIDLEGRSIGSLCYLQEYDLLLVAANDHRKPTDLSDPNLSNHKYYNNTVVYAYRWTDFTKEPEELFATKNRRAFKGEFITNGAKLEGIAHVDDHLWLAFDGPNSEIRRIPVSVLPESWLIIKGN